MPGQGPTIPQALASGMTDGQLAHALDHLADKPRGVGAPYRDAYMREAARRLRRQTTTQEDDQR